MKKLVFILTLTSLFITNTLIANIINNSIEDSLLNKVIYEDNIELKVDNYLALIRFYQKTNLQKSIEFCDAALKLCDNDNLKLKSVSIKIEKAKSLLKSGMFEESSKLITVIEKDFENIDDNLYLGKLYLLKNLYNIYKGDFTKAMENALKSLAYFQKTENKLYIAKVYNNIGALYDVTDNNKKALEYYLLSQKIIADEKDLDFLSILYNNIGIIYNNLEDTAKALKYYYKSLEYSNLSGNLLGSSTAFANIATVLNNLGRYEEAMVYFTKARNISLITHNISNINLLNINIGQLYINMNMFDSAEYFLNKNLSQIYGTNDKYNLSITYNSLGIVYIQKNMPNKAVDAFKKSIDFSKKTGVLQLQESSLKNLSEIYSQLKNYETAFEYLKQANIIADSIKSLNKNEELKYNNFQIEFSNQSNKFENELRSHKEYFNIELNKQKKEKYLFALLLILIIIIAIYIYRNFNKSKKTNIKLIKQNHEIEEQKELIEISNIELREQHAFIETLLNTIPNPVFYTDRNNNILGCNKAFEDISGKTIDNLMKVNIDKLGFKQKLSYDTTEIFKNPEKSLVRIEGTMNFNDGIEHDIICYRKGIVIAGEKLISILGIIIDITDLKETEKQLKTSQNELKNVINTKDKFFNIMAHDLKNPFNAILGLTSIISTDYEQLNKTEIKQYSSLINQSATQIYNLLENLLEWARTQSGTIERKPLTFIINEIINECSELFNHNLKQKSIKLNINTKKEIKVFADKNMIMTVLRNLISNAIKYTKNNGQINIEVQESESFANISIKDNGIGITPENMEHLFKIDQPISTPGVENEKGTGLGLIICKEFVEQNCGNIKVESQPDTGATFSFTIPVKPIS